MHLGMQHHQSIVEQFDVVLFLKKPAATQLQLRCIKRIHYLYFVINELFTDSLVTLLCIAKEALFEQTALTKHCTQKYLLMGFIVCLLCFLPKFS